MNSSLNTITNELLLKYDDNFNESYNKIININSSIMNKEELVIKENDLITTRDTNIIILQWTSFFIILFGITLMMNAFEKINLKKLLMITGVLIFVYICIITYIIVYKDFMINWHKEMNHIKVQMKDYVDEIAQDITDYTCPVQCEDNPSPSPNPGTISGPPTPTLNIDPQTNVWQYGDIPMDLYTSSKTPGSDFYTSPTGIPNYRETVEEDIMAEPKSFFGTTFPSSTYYTCSFMGGTNNDILPNKEPNKYTSIPCSYRPNFTETGRYICKENPNTSTKTLDTICDNVSLLLHS